MGFFKITLAICFFVFCPAKEDSSTLSGGSPRHLFTTGGPHLLQEPQLSRGAYILPLHCLLGMFTCDISSLLCVCLCVLFNQELVSLCGGDLSSALPWLELHTLNFSYNSIVCLDQSIVRPHKHSAFSVTMSLEAARWRSG